MSVCSCACRCVHTSLCAYVLTCLCIYVSLCSNVCPHSHACRCAHVSVRACVVTCLCMLRACRCVCVCVFMCVHVFVCICVCIRACVSICVFACSHVGRCVHAHVCVFHECISVWKHSPVTLSRLSSLCRKNFNCVFSILYPYSIQSFYLFLFHHFGKLHF